MNVPWYGVMPFLGLLLAMASFPLLRLTQHWWEKPANQLKLSLGLGVPVAAWLWVGGEHHAVVHALTEYAQFILLLGCLFVVSGGIFLSGDIPAHPKTNVAFLAVGALLASLIGTTGASMLLIRPLLNTNRERKFVTHTVVFAIFVVANAGGLLTPLGDPPLFLGMLRGVPFWWTLKLWPYWLFTNGSLLYMYWRIDQIMYHAESARDIRRDEREVQPLRLMGWGSLVCLAAVVLAVAFLPSPARELVMLGAAMWSYHFGHAAARKLNEFSFGPIREVAYLFMGIFLTMIPALKALKQVAPSLPLDQDTLYLFPGVLSALLDNAPTYAVFFEMAQSLGAKFDGVLVAGVNESLLTSISLGAVLWGAFTYIGNGPNLMVRAVAVDRGITMPSFFGYMWWSVRFLLPVLLAVGVLQHFELSLWALPGAVLCLFPSALFISRMERQFEGVEVNVESGVGK